MMFILIRLYNIVVMISFTYLACHFDIPWFVFGGLLFINNISVKHTEDD